MSFHWIKQYRIFVNIFFSRNSSVQKIKFRITKWYSFSKPMQLKCHENDWLGYHENVNAVVNIAINRNVARYKFNVVCKQSTDLKFNTVSINQCLWISNHSNSEFVFDLKWISP